MLWPNIFENENRTQKKKRNNETKSTHLGKDDDHKFISNYTKEVESTTIQSMRYWAL